MIVLYISQCKSITPPPLCPDPNREDHNFNQLESKLPEVAFTKVQLFGSLVFETKIFKEFNHIVALAHLRGL